MIKATSAKFTSFSFSCCISFRAAIQLRVSTKVFLWARWVTLLMKIPATLTETNSMMLATNYNQHKQLQSTQTTTIHTNRINVWSDPINRYKHVLYSKTRFLENHFYVAKNSSVINFLLLVKATYITSFGNENSFNVILLICLVSIICNIVVYIYIYTCTVYMYFGCDYHC